MLKQKTHNTHKTSKPRKQHQKKRAHHHNKRKPAHTIAKRHASDSLGFSWPVSRQLDGVVNMDLFITQTPEIIDQIWSDYHATSSTAIGLSISSAEHEKLKQRGSATPFFIHPVVRDTGYFMMLSQFQDNAFLVTYLEDFKTNPQNAQPYMTVTIYDELQHSKDLVLVRSDICSLTTINKQDSDFITRTLIQSYINDDMYQNVYNFNKHPQEFNFEKYIQEVTGAQNAAAASNPATPTADV